MTLSGIGLRAWKGIIVSKDTLCYPYIEVCYIQCKHIATMFSFSSITKHLYMHVKLTEYMFACIAILWILIFILANCLFHT